MASENKTARTALDSPGWNIYYFGQTWEFEIKKRFGEWTTALFSGEVSDESSRQVFRLGERGDGGG